MTYEVLKERIKKDGKVKDGNILKVDSFLNHQIDVDLIDKIGEEFYNRFKDEKVTKILTIETSGIPLAVTTARHFKCPVVFAKKMKTKNISGEVYTAKVMSFTHGINFDVIVSKDFLGENDRVLVIDDFLANGEAITGLMKIIDEAGAELVGCGVAIEKGFQPGGESIRRKGIRLESLVIVDALNASTNTIVFRD
ncbi:MAG: xanthine phosphoribosyltransferase [Lachnospiraceae bacterium]|nr:xanthine phosphoribosyltransferase [Lachnospiraceae bacterium]